MKVLCIALLVTLVCIQKVDSLWCFRCEDQTSNWKCLNMIKCAKTDKYCMTTVTTGGRDKNNSYRLSKKCVPTCNENFNSTELGGFSVKCCKSSFCNFKGE